VVFPSLDSTFLCTVGTDDRFACAVPTISVGVVAFMPMPSSGDAVILSPVLMSPFTSLTSACTVPLTTTCAELVPLPDNSTNGLSSATPTIFDTFFMFDGATTLLPETRLTSVPGAMLLELAVKPWEIAPESTAYAAGAARN